VKGNILEFEGDAIVNAANEMCLGGGGIDGAITDAGGEDMQKARENLPEIEDGVRCPTGRSVITTSGDLRRTTPIKYVIHAVGPVFKRGVPMMSPVNQESRELVESAVVHALITAASEPTIRRVAFPVISGGIFASGQEFDAIWSCFNAFDSQLRIGCPLYGRFDEVAFYAYTDEEYSKIQNVYNY